MKINANYRYFLFILFALITGLVRAQTPCYQSLFSEGMQFFKARNYDQAIEHFIDAQDCWDEPDAIRNIADIYKDSARTLWVAELDSARASAIKYGIEQVSLRKIADSLKRESEKIGTLIRSFYHADMALQALEEGEIEEAYAIAFHNLDSLNRYNRNNPKDTIPIPRVVKKAFGNTVFARDKRISFAHNGGIIKIIESEKGDRFLSIGRDRKVMLWTSSCEKLDSLQHEKTYFLSAAFSKDADLILVTARDSSARIWEIATGKETGLKGHTGAVLNGAFLDEDQVITISQDGTARIWDRSGKTIHVFSGDGSPIIDLAFSPNKQTVLLRSLRKVDLLKLEAPYSASRLTHNGSMIYGASFSPNGQQVLTWSANKEVRVWDTTDPTQFKRMLHDSAVYTASFSIDGKVLITGTEKGNTWRWSLDNINGEKVSWGAGVDQKMFAEKVFLLSNKQPLIWLKDTSLGMYLLDSVVIDNQQTRINAVSLSPNGRRFVVGLDGGVTKLLANSGEKLMDMEMGAAPVSHAFFSRDGEFIIAGTGNGTIYLTPLPDIAYQKIKSGKQPIPIIGPEMKHKIDTLFKQ